MLQAQRPHPLTQCHQFILRMALKRVVANNTTNTNILIHTPNAASLNNQLHKNILNKNEFKITQHIEHLQQNNQLYTSTLNPADPTHQRNKVIADNAVHKTIKQSYKYTNTRHIQTTVQRITQQRIKQQFQLKGSKPLNEFFPTGVCPKHIRHTFYTTQFYTGHGFFKSYLSEKRLARNPFCSCRPRSRQTPEHLLLHCPLTKNIITSQFTPQPSSLQQFILNPLNAAKFCTVTRQIYHKFTIRHRTRAHHR